jgi:hypothetical protein
MTEQTPESRDHWLMMAEMSDLTLEGHRLIAMEIAFELKLAWRGLRGWVRTLTGAPTRRPGAPNA